MWRPHNALLAVMRYDLVVLPAHRAIERLVTLKPAQPPAPGCSAPGKAQQQLAARRRTQLWADIVNVAWAAKLEETVRAAAPWVLAQQWGGVDKEMVILQVSVAQTQMRDESFSIELFSVPLALGLIEALFHLAIHCSCNTAAKASLLLSCW